VRRLDKEKIETSLAPEAIGPYSQGVKCSAGSFVFVSGQIAAVASGGIAGETAGEQADQCLVNIAAILEAAGADMDSVVKVTLYLKSMEDFSEVNEVYSRFFEAPYPARACIGGLDLPRGALVEIEAIAALG
jgi:2-iminobutanoate/2-iminopropanoate deaminase